MKFFRFFIAASAIIVFAASAVAQQPVCQLKQAPEFNGFRLGMALTDVRQNLADASMFEMKMAGVNKIGVQAMKVLGSELKDEYAEGIDDIQLTFVDSRLAVIRGTYNGAMTWMGAKDFFKQTSEKLGLPNLMATNSSNARGNEKSRIVCAGFVAVLAYSFGVSPNVTIYDVVAQKLVEERAIQNPDGEVKNIDLTPRSRPPVTRQPPR